MFGDVPAAVRDRDELPADAPGADPDVDAAPGGAAAVRGGGAGAAERVGVAALRGPVDAAAGRSGDPLERLRWETMLLWLLHVVEEAFGVNDVTYTELLGGDDGHAYRGNLAPASSSSWRRPPSVHADRRRAALCDALSWRPEDSLPPLGSSPPAHRTTRSRYASRTSGNTVTLGRWLTSSRLPGAARGRDVDHPGNLQTEVVGQPAGIIGNSGSIGMKAASVGSLAATAVPRSA